MGVVASKSLAEMAVCTRARHRSFDCPSAGMHGKANLAGPFAHDLDDDPGRICHAFGGIGAIGESPLDERIQRAGRL